MMLHFGKIFTPLAVLIALECVVPHDAVTMYITGPTTIISCGSDNDKVSEECKIDSNESCHLWAKRGDCQNRSTKNDCQFSCSKSGQLWQAAWRGDLQDIDNAIGAGANTMCPNTFTHKGIPFFNKTAIHMAALGNHPRAVKTLLDANVDVNLQTSDGITPIYDASWNGSIDALNMLIGHNANVNLPNIDGATPIAVAAKKGYSRAAKILIDANADVNFPFSLEQGSYTPLHLAAYYGQIELVQILIDANVNIDASGGFSNGTALHEAAAEDHNDITLLLLESGIDPRKTDKDGDTAADRARKYGNDHLADLIMRYI